MTNKLEQAWDAHAERLAQPTTADTVIALEKLYRPTYAIIGYAQEPQGMAKYYLADTRDLAEARRMVRRYTLKGYYAVRIEEG